MAKQERLDIILGAKDRATSVIGRLRGKLGGLAKMATSLPAVLGAGLSAGAVIAGGKAALSAYNEQEKAIEKLRQALEAAGEEGASSLGSITSWASELQQVTTQGDEATIALAGYISTVGELSGDALMNATQATLGLAAATGQGEKIMGRAYLNALQGNFSMLERYAPALRAATTEQEKMAIVQGLVSRGLGQMQAEAETTSGRMQQMKNAWGDTLEFIGGAIAPVAANVAQQVTAFLQSNGQAIGEYARWIVGTLTNLGGTVAGWFNSIGGMVADAWNSYVDFMAPYWAQLFATVQAAGQFIGEAMTRTFNAVGDLLGAFGLQMQGTGGWFEWLRDTAVGALALVQIGMAQWKDRVSLITNQAMLVATKAFETVKHWITVVIPNVLEWFGDNWDNILKDYANIAKSVWVSIGTNIKNVMKEVWDYISSGGTDAFKVDWTIPLADFESSIQEWPGVAERATTDAENIMTTNIATLRKKLNDGYGKMIDELAQKNEERADHIRNTLRIGGDPKDSMADAALAAFFAGVERSPLATPQVAGGGAQFQGKDFTGGAGSIGGFGGSGGGAGFAFGVGFAGIEQRAKEGRSINTRIARASEETNRKLDRLGDGLVRLADAMKTGQPLSVDLNWLR